MLDHVYAALDVAKSETSRIDAFRSPATGPVATLVEDRIVPLMLPVRDWKQAVRGAVGASPASRLAGKAVSSSVALLWLGLGERGGLLDALLGDPRHLGYNGIVLGAMGGGHVPEVLVDRLVAYAERLTIVVASRSGGGPLLRATPTAARELRSRWAQPV